jgi:hypothetical protein
MSSLSACRRQPCCMQVPGRTLPLHASPRIVAWSTPRRIAELQLRGPESSWAGAGRAGCAFVRVTPPDGSAITPAAALECIDPASFDRNVGRRGASSRACGLCHRGAPQRCGARAGTARALRAPSRVGRRRYGLRHPGIASCAPDPRHRAVPWQAIFHGLGNDCVVTRALNAEQAHPMRAAWGSPSRRCAS